MGEYIGNSHASISVVMKSVIVTVMQLRKALNLSGCHCIQCSSDFSKVSHPPLSENTVYPYTMDDRDQSDSFIPAINFTDLAYAAPFLGAILLGCFALSICCYLWRRVSSSRRNIDLSSSISYRNYERPLQSPTQRPVLGQNQTYGRGRSMTRGHQFVSWARDQMQFQRNATRSSLPGQNYRSPQQSRGGCGTTTTTGNNLRSPMATQYPPAAQGSRVRSDQNPGGTTLSNSEGFSQATAPPPSYSHAVGYQSVTAWNLPGYGYQSTEPRTIASGQGGGGDMGQGENNGELPPPYEAAVANEQNARRT